MFTDELGFRVPDEESTNWGAAAFKARLALYILDPVVDPRPGSALAGDDESYQWEKCSAWARASLIAAIDHLVLWANVVAPQKLFDGMIVSNPPRPYYTLARAALESAAQSLWVLKPEDSSERVHRHLRLLYHDLRQLALALEQRGNGAETEVRGRMEQTKARVGNAYPIESITRGEPKYLAMIRECAPLIKMDSAQLEILWRGASAAAHGKNWFQYVGYTMTIGEEYEPGYFRAAFAPDPAAITETATAAADLTLYAVLRYITRAGFNPEPLQQAAMAKLMAETPLNPERA